MIKTLPKWYKLAAILVACIGLYAGQHDAEAQSKPVTVNTRATTANETIACNAGVSPCTIGTASTVVLNTNINRHECLLQNVGVTNFYCLKGAGTASATRMHFVLKAASAANAGDGAVYSCSEGSVVWGGVISCASSATGGLLNASGD